MSAPKNILLSIALSFSLTGCASWLDPFAFSDEASMAAVAMKVPLGDELEGWLASAAGKKVVIVNMENSAHTDDQAPEYLLHDALVARLSNAKAETVLLERDPDLLAIMGNERGDNVRYTAPTDPSATTTVAERRKAVGDMIGEVVDTLAQQDAIVIAPGAPGSDSATRGGKVIETIAANEVGTTKAALLRELVGQYADLYKVTPSTTVETASSVAGTDFLFAYRIYDFGTWSIKNTRLTYIKAHVRVVDMKTGQIVASDFIEKRIEDEINTSERLNLINTKTSQSDYGRPASRTSDSGAGAGSLFSKPSDAPSDAPAGKGAKKGK